MSLRVLSQAQMSLENVASSASAASSSTSSPLDKVAELLDKTIRVRISDGRIVMGDLQCLDRELNLVLINAVEYYNSSGNICGIGPCPVVCVIPFIEKPFYSNIPQFVLKTLLLFPLSTISLFILSKQ